MLAMLSDLRAAMLITSERPITLDHVFIIATVIMAIALVVVFFLPEIKLRRTNQNAIEESGFELEGELSQSDSDNEPEL